MAAALAASRAALFVAASPLGRTLYRENFSFYRLPLLLDLIVFRSLRLLGLVNARTPAPFRAEPHTNSAPNDVV